MNYYVHVLKNYATFTGRARRKEYWMFFLFNMIFLIIAAVIDHLLGTCFKINIGDYPQALPYGYVYMAYALAVFIPGLAVAVRRLHDVGKSGWFMLIALIPIIGGIWLLVLVCTAGTVGPNDYGPDPKQAA